MDWKMEVAAFLTRRFDQVGVPDVACAVLQVSWQEQYIAVSADLPGDPAYGAIVDGLKQIPEVSYTKVLPSLELGNSPFITNAACLSLPIRITRQTVADLREGFKASLTEYSRSKDFVDHYGHLPAADAEAVAAYMLLVSQELDFDQMIERVIKSGASNQQVMRVRERLKFIREAQRAVVAPNPGLEKKIKALLKG